MFEDILCIGKCIHVGASVCQLLTILTEKQVQTYTIYTLTFLQKKNIINQDFPTSVVA